MTIDDLLPEQDPPVVSREWIDMRQEDGLDKLTVGLMADGRLRVVCASYGDVAGVELTKPQSDELLSWLIAQLA